MTPPSSELRDLARLRGLQTAYVDIDGRRRTASEEGLVAVLEALGTPVGDPGRATTALGEARRETSARVLEPVLVAWEGRLPEAELRLPEGHSPLRVEYRIEPCDVPGGEPAASREGILPLRPSRCSSRRSRLLEGVRAWRLEIPTRLVPGYHRLHIRTGRIRAESLVIAAPRRAPEPEGDGRLWGLFIPLHALWRRKGWGCGDFSDLASLGRWVGERNGDLVGTLPLMPAFLERSCDPSPYAPVSRLFLNELYIDVEAIPEIESCPGARRLLGSPAFLREVRALRRRERIDYRRLMELKRRFLELLSRTVEKAGGARQRAFRRFASKRPEVVDYARFRAVAERQRLPWRYWPRPIRDGSLRRGDFDERAARYHLYAQWIAEEQILAALGTLSRSNVRLYLDLPLGVHPAGYDTYRHRRIFVTGASAGAPPDPFFSGGQCWGFPPMHPQRLRESGYGYLIASLRRILSLCGVLRFDHVMGLHRIFFVPEGMPPTEGVYVRYPHEELYAILCLEAARAGTAIVGEDLGTVPGEIRRTMAAHGLHRMYVLQYAAGPDLRRALPPAPRRSLACLNTHDMPPFASFWSGREIDDRVSLGILSRQGRWRERRSRAAVRRALVEFLRKTRCLEGKPTVERALRACIRFLARSRARFALINLEDLWLETRPQNVPGTGAEQPNWRGRAAYPVESLSARVLARQVTADLRRLRGTRGERGRGSPAEGIRR